MEIDWDKDGKDGKGWRRARIARKSTGSNAIAHGKNFAPVRAKYRRVFADAEILAQHGPVKQIVKDGKPVKE